MTPPRIDLSVNAARKVLELVEDNLQARFLLCVAKHRSGDVVSFRRQWGRVQVVCGYSWLYHDDAMLTG